MRAIAKIAFNYLAYTTGNNFALNKSFDMIRSFIRYGDGNPNNFFHANSNPILHDDKKLKPLKLKTTEGHIIIVEWNSPSTITSKISFFNINTYNIFFCKNYNSVWIPINSGHHFDIKTKTISKLISAKKGVLI